MSRSSTVQASDKKWIIYLCLIVVAAVGLRVYSAAGFIPKDDAEFAKVAYEMSQGTFEYDEYAGPPVIPVRTGIVLPTAASMKVLGIGEVQLAAYPLISSILMILLIYLFTAKMFSHHAARIASLIWVFLPVEIEIATTLWPEVPATAFAFLGIYTIYTGRENISASWRRRFFIGIAGGLAFGASWLCKASVIYFAPFCLLLIAIDLKRTRLLQLRLWGGIAAGSLAVLCGEALVYGISNDDWLYRFTAIQNNYLLYPEFFFSEGARFGYEVGMPFWKAVIKRVAIDGPAFIFANGHFLYLPIFGAIAAIYGIYRRDQRFYFMAGLMLVLVLMFNGFSASLENYQPLPLFNRYFYAICVPAAVLAGGMLAILVPSSGLLEAARARSETMFWGALIVLVLGSLIAWSTFRQVRDYQGTWSAGEKHLATVLQPTDRIHTDVMSRNALEFFWKYPSRMNIEVYGEPGYQPSIQCDDFVLRNNSYIHWLSVNYGSWMTLRGFEVPPRVQSPPAEWQQTWTNGNATLYQVACDR